jgi:predicted RNase H-like HicB family nuclease
LIADCLPIADYRLPMTSASVARHEAGADIHAVRCVRPDLPGCVATGATREETERRMYETIELHIEGPIEDRQPVPQSTSFAEYVVVRG